MENQNNSNFTIVSMDVFAQVLSQIPEGKIIRVSDLIRFFEKSFGVASLLFLNFLTGFLNPMKARLKSTGFLPWKKRTFLKLENAWVWFSKTQTIN